MKNSALIAPIIFVTASAFAIAGEHPSFSEADANNDGTLSTQELSLAVPQLDLQDVETKLTAADVKRVMPEIEFNDVDVVNAVPISEEQYLKIVEFINEKEETGSVSSI